MRLYLSSYRLSHPERLRELLGDKTKVAVIANAQDAKEPEVRRERVAAELEELRAAGLEPYEMDLRDYFSVPFTNDLLADYDMVWVRGGNVFNLRRAMRYSRFDKVATELVRSDRIVWGGYSAGACVVAPDLHGIEFCDPIDLIPQGYKTEIVWGGLHLIPYAIAPHYLSEHYESAKIDEVVAYMNQHNIPYRTLRDGEAIIINGEQTEMLT